MKQVNQFNIAFWANIVIANLAEKPSTITFALILAGICLVASWIANKESK